MISMAWEGRRGVREGVHRLPCEGKAFEGTLRFVPFFDSEWIA